MQCTNFDDAVEMILDEDGRYDREAYVFTREALDYTYKMLNKPRDGVRRHVSGIELLDGIRAFALEELGPVSKLVLNTWGVHRTEDFGDIVFRLIDKGALGKTESDKKEDFGGGYDFNEAFVKPFLPRQDDPGKSSTDQPPDGDG
jgi:uncharacterized repeat protein (TIGR04138 family)